MDCSLPGSSVHGILQARVLEWVATSFSRESSGPGIELASLLSPALAGRFFTTQLSGKPCIKLGVVHNNEQQVNGEKLELFWEKYKMTENRDNLKSVVNTPKW